MIFRPDRAARGPDRFLDYKIAVFVLGAVAGVAGIATERGWLVFAGIALLAVGLVLRVIAARVRSD